VIGAVSECVNVTSGEGRLCLELFQNVLMYHQERGDCVWSCFEMCSWKMAYFDSVPISNRQYDDLQSTLNNKTQPHCHSSFYSGLKFEQE